MTDLPSFDLSGKTALVKGATPTLTVLFNLV